MPTVQHTSWVRTREGVRKYYQAEGTPIVRDETVPT